MSKEKANRTPRAEEWRCARVRVFGPRQRADAGFRQGGAGLCAAEQDLKCAVKEPSKYINF